MDRCFEPQRVFFDQIASPVGELYLAVDASGAAIRIAFLRDRDARAVSEGLQASGRLPQRDARACAGVARQLGEYFEGRRRDFDLALAPQISICGCLSERNVVPCHRVIGAGGRLTGYGGGLEAKTWLLRHEGGWAEQAALPLDATSPMMNR